MFTGIVSKKAKILATTDTLGIKKVTVEKEPLDGLRVGESVSINGVCSTVVDITEHSFSVDYMPETLKKTTMKHIVADSIINIEKSLKVGDRLDGHFVYGHIDCMGCIEKIKSELDSKVFSVSIPKEFHKYVCYKGSVAVDGVSLTISAVTKNGFEVSLIPYTLSATTLGEKKVSDVVNIETDIIARYIERLNSKSESRNPKEV